MNAHICLRPTLTSAIGAPVRSRSCLMIAAEPDAADDACALYGLDRL